MVVLLESFGNNWQDYCNACYKIYTEAWDACPCFMGKPIIRDSALDADTGKERAFWGLVQGHNDGIVYNHMQRYENIDLFKSIIMNLDSDKYHKCEMPKRRIKIFSRNYEITLKKNGQNYVFITGFPIGDGRYKANLNKMKAYKKLT
jgi:hypothetical protein